MCRELGQQQWPGSLAPAPRTDIRERKEVYIKHTKGCTEQAEGGSSKPEGARGADRGRRGSAAPTETSRSGQARTWGRTLQAGETAKALGRQQVGRHGPPRPWG